MTLATPLEPRVLARLARVRLAADTRITGSREGGHRSIRHGSSLEFADQRPYLPGDDLRTLDIAASRRLGRPLVRVHEASDDLSLRVVVDASASMAFGGKSALAGRIAQALAQVAANGGDRARVLVATRGSEVVASPWLQGPATTAIVNRLLGDLEVVEPDLDRVPGPAPLVEALHRAHGEGPSGRVVLVSDLLLDDWDRVLGALAGGGGTRSRRRVRPVLVHLLGTDDLEPELSGDVDLVDAETGAIVSLAGTEQVLVDHRRAMEAWRGEVADEAAHRGVAVLAVDETEDVASVVAVGLRRLGVVT